MLIAYIGNDEIIVTTLKYEARTIKEFFSDPEDRDIDNYDREIASDKSMSFSCGMKLEW